MSILVTGGLGFIGSHTCVELLRGGYSVIVIDDLSNSSPIVCERISATAGRAIRFVEGSANNTALLDQIFANDAIDAVIHFAGLKAVGDSVREPIRYYNINVGSTLNLLSAMSRAGVWRLVFSSSATVYGDTPSLPLKENTRRSATNPYGRSKLIQEQILEDVAKSDSRWRIASLRYFNPVGAHERGLIGEDPRGTPNNLMPYLLQVAIGQRPELQIFGGDYPTHDGTCIRDFIHVQDLAAGHIAALKYLNGSNGYLAVNLGTGAGTSVLALCTEFEQATGQKIVRRIVDRRPGDVPACWADTTLAHSVLQWKATRDLATMCRDAWNWQVNNPNGYGPS